MPTYRNVTGQRTYWPFLPEREGGQSYELDPDEAVTFDVAVDVPGLELVPDEPTAPDPKPATPAKPAPVADAPAPKE